MRIEQSNRLEILSDRLLERLKSRAHAAPLAATTIIVPNPGMGRWLVQRWAEHEGIAANLDLPLPASFFWRVLRAWLPDEEASPFDRDTLVWRILAALPDMLGNEAARELQRYLEAEHGDAELRRFQLAGRIADVFDQYLVFRPEMVLAWEEGRDEHWQAQLWRRIVAAKMAHRAHLLRKLQKVMASGPPADHALPDNLHFFGLNALPPVYLDILQRLAAYRTLHLYHLNPCREYWADIRDQRSLAHHSNPQEAFLELGNPLLASMGHVGQVFLDQLVTLEAEVQEHYVSPEGQGMLSRVQEEILTLRDGRETPCPLPQQPWPSIQFHGTHSRLREVQVMHDNLLRCFEEYDELKPRDILVMAPDMASYAPLVEAVFATAERKRAIPYSIGDRSVGGEQPLGEAIRWLLKLPTSRFTASEVLALLEVDAVQGRFGIEEEALERIRGWVREGGIRWGLHSQHREALGLPAGEGLHSWEFGLKRLFLGFATPADAQQRLYADGTAPYLDIESGELPWAGALQGLLELLGAWRQRLSGSRDLEQWREELSVLLDDFFLPRADEDTALLLSLNQRLDELIRQAEPGGFQGPLSLQVMGRLLENALDDTAAASGFLQGGVTFSNLLPMRALPYRVICLLGMNDTDFPRRQKPPSFDRMAQEPLRTDRDRRRDDRYLFLETLISARDCLLISWQSRDERSNQERLPAEVVTELLDYLGGCYALEDQDIRKTFQVQHRLQAFSPAYFRDPDDRLFSYDDTWAVENRERGKKPFVVAPLEKDDWPDEVALDELIRFFHNPARAFLQRSLSMRLPADEDLQEDSEPFALDGLQHWQLRDRLLAELREDQAPDLLAGQLKGQGLLPHGVAGENTWEDAFMRTQALHARLRPLLEDSPWKESLSLDIALDHLRLVGRVERYTGQGVLDYRIGKLRGQDRLKLWIAHLAVAAQTGKAAESLLVAEDLSCRLSSIDRESARGYLNTLADLYRRGLREPLQFFPRTSWKYVNQDRKWEAEWRGSEYSTVPGEGNDAAHVLAFRDREALDGTFAQLSETIYRPLIDHLEEA